ncbi:hypothetical protein F7Q99_29825 [Streptomyces kaniharaensis]|uniref:Uncharacterized protein n=1 Tax=Streptomyces kaniharaensis TaxID=212423 RepID=A0A6N7L3A8_9ACTN|nr:hypothetical protein [Streptomyces kaniharaensis]MQS16303.1 hypothetical protein [Streptomyces kaniharaensis]
MNRILTLPLTVPASLAEAHGLDPAVGGWAFTPRHAVATPDGDTYVVSTVWRTWQGKGDPTDPTYCQLSCRSITRYTPDGTPVATALFGHPRPDGTPSAIIPDGDGDTLAVLPDGTIALSLRPGSTHLFSSDLSQVLATWPMPWGFEETKARTGDPFAASITVTPSGRLLCMTSEYGLSNWADSNLNIVAVSDPGSTLAPGSKATLRAIASLHAKTDRQTDADQNPHVVYGDAPVWRDNRPSPTLTDLLSELTGTSGSLYGYEDCKMTRPAALGDDLFVIPVFGQIYRSTNRGQEFSFALLDDQGALRGRLEGLHRYDDSPFTGFDFTVVADPHRGRAFHLNRYGFFAWSADGQLRSRMSTADKPYKPLKNFELLECTPAGEILLAHRKQNVLLRVPVPEDLDILPAAVETALKGYASGRLALKKQYAPVNWYWLDTAAQVFHH